MSYAQVIVRFANVSDPATFAGVTATVQLRSLGYAAMQGWPSWNVQSEPDGRFEIHTLSSATAESYRSKFLKAFGPNGTFAQNDITVSPVMASMDPTKP